MYLILKLTLELRLIENLWRFQPLTVKDKLTQILINILMIVQLIDLFFLTFTMGIAIEKQASTGDVK